MADPLAQANALIALAVSESNEEAARTAALQAARLMFKHGFEVTRKDSGSDAGPAKAHVDYSPEWAHAFWAADPMQGQPEVLLAMLRWTPTDLVRVMRDRRKISPVKIRELAKFCLQRRVPLPFDEDHPAFETLRNLTPAQAIALGMPVRKEGAIEGILKSVTAKDLFDFFRK